MGPQGGLAVMGIPPGGGGALGGQPLSGSGAAPAQGITHGYTAGTEFRFAPTNQATEEQRRLYAANLGRDLASGLTPARWAPPPLLRPDVPSSSTRSTTR